MIGLVGNSGNTTAPHLHFHVMDGREPLAGPHAYELPLDDMIVRFPE